ncbi:MAG: hypothetical protein WKF75_11040 [Singulisphaera sp.]
MTTTRRGRSSPPRRRPGRLWWRVDAELAPAAPEASNRWARSPGLAVLASLAQVTTNSPRSFIATEASAWSPLVAELTRNSPPACPRGVEPLGIDPQFAVLAVARPGDDELAASFMPPRRAGRRWRN